MIDRTQITAIILCGGQGARIGGQDKPLLQLNSRHIIDYVIERIQPQVNSILLSCSRNVALYESKGFPVVVDKDFAKGPLGGLSAAFKHLDTEWALTIPGDTPFVSESIVKLLARDAVADGLAIPSVDGIRQNLLMLLNRTTQLELSAFYEQGGSAVKHWLDSKGIQSVNLNSIKASFFNVNTAADLNHATRYVTEFDI